MIFDRVVNFNIAAPKQYQIFQIVSTYNIRHAVTILVQGLGLVVVGKDREYLSYTEYSTVSVLAVETAGPGSWILKFSGQPFVFLCLWSIFFEQILKITETLRRFRKCTHLWRAMRHSKMRSISIPGWS